MRSETAMTLRHLLPALAALLLVFASGSARADIAPPNACNDVGATCNTAMGSSSGYDSSGTCQNTTCQKYGGLPDGGLGTYSYPCMLCVAGDAGSSSGASAADGAVTGPAQSADAATGETTSGSTGKSSSGCDVSPTRVQLAGPLVLVVLGAIVVAASRRRRNDR
jgi:MYXO-CTERM domain-containing protein